MNAFVWLLKREYWEHRGGFFWAPIWAGIVIFVLTLLGAITGEVGMRRSGISFGGRTLGDITSHMAPEDLARLGSGIDMALYTLCGIFAIVLFFVTFFYLLGALYDDRRDRSVLFWKSLPLSDLETVLSKVVTAIVVAPLFSAAAAIALMFAFLALVSVFVAFHGVNPVTTIWLTASPLSVAIKILALLPINALWALPCVGWLLLVSAFAKRAPFLWAVAVPVVAGVLVSWVDLMQGIHLPDAWFWKQVVARALFSIAPGSWLDAAELRHLNGHDPIEIADALSIGTIGSALTRPTLWIGAAVGSAMIAGAVLLRRWRDDS